MIIEGIKIIASPGLVLRRKIDGLTGNEFYLGTLYYLNGEPLDPPIEEHPWDFEEVSPEQLEEERRENLRPEYERLVDKYVREIYSVSDELAIQRQRDTKPEAFDEYFAYCEECKERAKKELGL